MKVHLVLLAISLTFTFAGSPTYAETADSWSAFKPYAKVKLNGNEFEAESGSAIPAIHQLGQVLHFQMIPGNKWAEDAPDGERTELDGYKQRLTPKTPYWASWSIYIEPGDWSTSDWLVLQQMPGLWGHIIQKGSHAMSFFLVKVPIPLASLPVASGVWYNFVERYVVGPSGSMTSWVNGKQVAGYSGSVGEGGSYYPKLGIYRGSQTAAGAPVREILSVRYANFKFGTTDLSGLINNPDPLPAFAPWP